jgi:hypothetical protein
MDWNGGRGRGRNPYGWQNGYGNGFGNGGRGFGFGYGNFNGRGYGPGRGGGIDPYRLQSVVYHVENEQAERRVQRKNALTSLVAAQCGPDMAAVLAASGAFGGSYGDAQDPLASTLLISQIMNRGSVQPLAGQQVNTPVLDASQIARELAQHLSPLFAQHTQQPQNPTSQQPLNTQQPAAQPFAGFPAPPPMQFATTPAPAQQPAPQQQAGTGTQQPAFAQVGVTLPPYAASHYAALDQAIRQVVKSILQDASVVTSGHVLHKLNTATELNGNKSKDLFDAIFDPTGAVAYDTKLQGLHEISLVLWQYKAAFIASA